MSDDWTRDVDRLDVMSQLATRVGIRLPSTVGTPQHCRSITLGYDGGLSAKIILDQGFGAWTTSSAPQFAFNESPARQVSKLAMLDSRVQARRVTYIVAQVI